MDLKVKLAYAKQMVDNIQGHTDEPKDTRSACLTVLEHYIIEAKQKIENEVDQPLDSADEKP